VTWSMNAKAEARLLNLICLLIGTIMLYRGIIDFFLFKDSPWRTVLGLVFFGGVASIFLMFRRYRVGWWLFAFFDFSVGLIFIFALQDIWYHHVLPHVAYAAVFLPFYKIMHWGSPSKPGSTLVPPEPQPHWTAAIVEPLINFVERSPWLARAIERIAFLQRTINRLVINSVTSAPPQRPHPYTLWTPDTEAIPRDPPIASPPSFGTFVSWPGLVDRSFTGRHLPPMSEADVAALPPIDAVTSLFERTAFQPSGKTSALFCFFAQWFTDSFLRTNPYDARKNTSNHEIDLCQIYGLGAESTRFLRDLAGGQGLLKEREGPTLPGGTKTPVYPPTLFDPLTLKVKDEFAGICFDPILATSFDHADPPHGLAKDVGEILESIGDWTLEPDRVRSYYAAGLERANSTIVYSALNTIFLREHNRLARELATTYPELARATNGDDWLFETARNINIVMLLKVIVEDYIAHLAGSPFKLRLEQGFADRCKWYRTNRIAIEFNLLYRWHAMVPDSFVLNDKPLANTEFRFNNALLETFGVEGILDAAARQHAGRLMLHNTPFFLMQPERKSISFARQFRLMSFNAYRRRWQLPSYQSIEELAGDDHALVAELKRFYPDRHGVPGVERIELPVGLLAEQRKANQPLPDLLRRMVGSDAFSQALTNPLLAAYVYGADCFTDYGLTQISNTQNFADIVHRNQTPGLAKINASFSLPEFDPNTMPA